MNLTTESISLKGQLTALKVNSNRFQQTLSAKKAIKGKLEEQYADYAVSITKLTEDAERYKKAAAFLGIVSENSQEAVIKHFENAATLVVQNIFGPGYGLKMNSAKGSMANSSISFAIVAPYESEDSLEVDPVGGQGGGMRDIVGMALRIAFLNLSKNEGVIFFDEPFKMLSAGYQDLIAQVLNMIRKELGKQMIVITHNERLMEHADKVIHVELAGTVSHIS